MIIVFVTFRDSHSTVSFKLPIPFFECRKFIQTIKSDGNTAVIPHVSVAAHKFFYHTKRRFNILLDKNIVVESVITVKYRHKSCKFGLMRYMIWCITR